MSKKGPPIPGVAGRGSQPRQQPAHRVPVKASVSVSVLGSRFKVSGST